MAKPIINAEYWKSINDERIYWKEQFYRATEGKIFSDQMLAIDKDIQERMEKRILNG